MKKLILLSCVLALLLMGLGGCDKKSADTVVIGKDHVAAVKQGEEIKDERAINHEQWILKVRMLDDGRTIQSASIERDGRNCAKAIGSKSRIAWANIPEPFGTPRLTEDLRKPRTRLSDSVLAIANLSLRSTT